MVFKVMDFEKSRVLNCPQSAMPVTVNTLVVISLENLSLNIDWDMPVVWLGHPLSAFKDILAGP